MCGVIGCHVLVTVVDCGVVIVVGRCRCCVWCGWSSLSTVVVVVVVVVTVVGCGGWW